MYNVLKTPIFGIVLTILFFNIGIYIKNKLKSPVLNPLLVAIVGIILFLSIFNIDYKDYKIGADSINFFLGPVTVVLAVPLYKQLDLLKKYFFEIIIGITLGVIVSFISIVTVCKLANTEEIIMNSLMAKSITTPMGISLTSTLGGIQSITVVAIILTGIFGGIISVPLFKIIKIKHPIAKGIALGTSAHALGTTKAIELGEVEGAMSGLAIGVAGIITVILIPILIKLVL
ncbi:MAG: LrgB family protein [Peptostreptococcaceae bacterium]|nr:LrgB family protein [Peptostreptococcaceae bacterium]